MKAQRLRLRYRVSADASALTNRQLMRAWQEAAESATLPLAYSQARRATPQISIAAPLPLGVTSDGELADIFLTEWIDPRGIPIRLSQTLPHGLEALAAWEVGLTAPSLQSQLRWAEYEVDVPTGGLSPDDAQLAIDRLLQARTFPWEQRRETKVRRYDLRPLILDLRLNVEGEGHLHLAMRLRAEQEMTGRADQVVAALGLPQPTRIHRRLLYVEETSPAVLAYRRLGQPDRG
ncbi:MAG: TIGR03936 family radical SAM-associated protein [Dehalococcoidia bacterium]